MSSVSRDRDREQLERELQRDEYEELLRDLQHREPFLRQFGTWADVLAFMRVGRRRDARMDRILRPIFRAHSQDEDPRWRAILLAIFWPGLRAIHFRRRSWDPHDPDEFWENIIFTFFQVVFGVDVDQRPDRLASKVSFDLFHRLYEEYCRFWDRKKREFTADPEKLDALAGGVEDMGFSAVELRAAWDDEIRRLRRHLEAGRINESDNLMLVGTRIYRQSLADYARETGLDYEVAKKRRLRAEATIRRFEKGMR